MLIVHRFHNPSAARNRVRSRSRKARSGFPTGDSRARWRFSLIPSRSRVLRRWSEPMSFSVFEIVIPGMLHGLNVLDDYVGHAASFSQSTGLSPTDILGARLAPDMLSFAEQIGVLCNKVEAHVAKL